MHVVVHFTTVARADLLALLTARGLGAGDAINTAEVFADDIAATLTRYAGPPPGAIRSRVRPGGYWWLYVAGVWVGVRRTDKPGTVFRARRRVLSVAAVQVRPPHA